MFQSNEDNASVNLPPVFFIKSKDPDAVSDAFFNVSVAFVINLLLLPMFPTKFLALSAIAEPVSVAAWASSIPNKLVNIPLIPPLFNSLILDKAEDINDDFFSPPKSNAFFKSGKCQDILLSLSNWSTVCFILAFANSFSDSATLFIILAYCFPSLVFVK